jgi:hypothetical protein
MAAYRRDHGGSELVVPPQWPVSAAGASRRVISSSGVVGMFLQSWTRGANGYTDARALAVQVSDPTSKQVTDGLLRRTSLGLLFQIIFRKTPFQSVKSPSFNPATAVPPMPRRCVLRLSEV